VIPKLYYGIKPADAGKKSMRLTPNAVSKKLRSRAYKEAVEKPFGDAVQYGEALRAAGQIELGSAWKVFGALARGLLQSSSLNAALGCNRVATKSGPAKYNCASAAQRAAGLRAAAEAHQRKKEHKPARFPVKYPAPSQKLGGCFNEQYAALDPPHIRYNEKSNSCRGVQYGDMTKFEADQLEDLNPIARRKAYSAHAGTWKL
jgi:nucleoid-associated protein YgaU